MDDVPSETVATIVAWIEQHLHEVLTLEGIAERAGYSSFHFARLFLAVTRRSVMAHVRGRRMVKAAKQLLSAPDTPISELAAGCGFDSQEAFTRSFRRTFGTTPTRFREGYAVEPIEGHFPMRTPSQPMLNVQLAPDHSSLGDLVLVGPARAFDQATKAEIPQLWSKLIGSLPLPGQVQSRAAYGVIFNTSREEGTFSYLAGVEMRQDAPCPPDYQRLVLAPATYAVFRIILDGGPIHDQMKVAMRAIWGRLIPEARLELTGAPDFERYDGNKPITDPGAFIDYHVPVVDRMTAKDRNDSAVNSLLRRASHDSAQVMQ